jgi:hypothetical protein
MHVSPYLKKIWIYVSIILFTNGAVVITKTESWEEKKLEKNYTEVPLQIIWLPLSFCTRILVTLVTYLNERWLLSQIFSTLLT